jgi:hypothetical protein
MTSIPNNPHSASAATLLPTSEVVACLEYRVAVYEAELERQHATMQVLANMTTRTAHQHDVVLEKLPSLIQADVTGNPPGQIGVTDFARHSAFVASKYLAEALRSLREIEIAYEAAVTAKWLAYQGLDHGAGDGNESMVETWHAAGMWQS